MFIEQRFVCFQYERSQVDSFFACDDIGTCLTHLEQDENYNLAIGSSRQHILNSPSYTDETIFCFKRSENILSYQLSLIMREGFRLNFRFNQLISNAFESGMIVQWERVSQRKRKRIIPNEPSLPLSIDQLGVAFAVILFWGSVLSFLSFISELIIHRKMKEERPHWIWSYFEQFFDGNRHYLKDLVHKKKTNNQRKPLRTHPIRNRNTRRTSDHAFVFIN